MALDCAAREFLRRMSIIWSSLLSDHNRVTYIHTYIHVRMHACIHTYIHTYIQCDSTDQQGEKLQAGAVTTAFS